MKHGTTHSYNNGGCRCESCAKAEQAYREEKQAEEQVPKELDTAAIALGHSRAEIRELWEIDPVLYAEVKDLAWRRLRERLEDRKKPMTDTLVVRVCQETGRIDDQKKEEAKEAAVANLKVEESTLEGLPPERRRELMKAMRSEDVA